MILSICVLIFYDKMHLQAVIRRDKAYAPAGRGPKILKIDNHCFASPIAFRKHRCKVN